MGEVEFNSKEDDEYNVKIVDSGEYKEPGGGVKKPSQEEIDGYKIHRIIVLIVFAIVVVVLLLIVVILIATGDRCEAKPKEEKLPWWKSGVVYNVYPRSFKDANGDGIGDFKGITEKLDHLNDLGVNILYLSSVFKIEQNVDYGYAVINFNETNTDYGTLKEFEKLIKAAHEKGIKVIIEFVPNDTSEKHQWFKDSRSSTSNAKRDWYIWQNDTSTSGNSSWTKDDKTGQYYLRRGKGLADLNWNNSEVREEMERVLGFWLDQGVDGFRVVSVAKLFDEVNPAGNDLARIHDTLRKWHNYTRKKDPGSILMGASHSADETYFGNSGPELDIVVNFKLVPENDEDMAKFYSAENFKNLINNYLKKIPKGKWPSWGLTSWVHRRFGSNVDWKLAKSLNVLLLTLPGTPIVFYGDEFGMVNVSSDRHPNEGNKSPMQWNNKENGGFSTKSPTWFGAVGNASVVNAEDDQRGIQKIFKDAVYLRAAENANLLKGNLANFTAISQGNVLAYTFKSKPKPSILVVINFDQHGAKSEVINLAELKAKEGDLMLYTSEVKPEGKNIEKIVVPPMALYVYKITKYT